MLCYPLDLRRLGKWPTPWIVQPKLDGVRCRAVPTEAGYVLLSSEENILYAPHITRELDERLLIGGSGHELDGELYLHGCPFETIVSLATRAHHPSKFQLEFHVFDIIEQGSSQLNRTLLLSTLFDTLPPKCPIKRVPHEYIYSEESISKMMDYFLRIGYEGIVLRNYLGLYEPKRSTNMMKWKPAKMDIYPIVGYTEEVSKDGVPKGALGSLTLVSDGQLFSVGSGLTATDREELWKVRESLIGKRCLVKYQHLTSGKLIPRFPVFVEII